MRHAQRLASGVVLLSGLVSGASWAQTSPTSTGTGAVVSVYAAGSLREAFTEIATAYEARTGTRIALTFGASGLLRERIEQGEGAQVFASADTQHPQRLANGDAWQAPQVFARNALCALTAPGLVVTPPALLDAMLTPSVRLGTSTPGSDPSGDYTWTLFRRTEALRAGAFAALDAKALKLTGATNSPKPPPGQGTYAWVMASGQADIFLTYCTNAVAARREVTALGVVAVVPELSVAAAYGLTVRRGASAEATAFAQSLLAPPAQQVLARLGFAAP